MPAHTSARIRSLLSSGWIRFTVLLFAMTALWSLGMPLMASPDEPSHAIKAAAVVRGQLDGPLSEAPVRLTEPGRGTIVQVPTDLARTAALADCFRFEEKEAADCAPALPEREPGLVDATTYAGQYPPLYYLLVGWPSLVLPGTAALYAMRLVTAAISTGFLVWGLRRLVGPGARRGLWGASVALTPMVFFMAGTVNPNGLEITSAFSFWAATTALTRHVPDPSPTPPVSLYVQAAVSGAVLVNLRTSGPLWAALILVFALLVARPGGIRAALRARAARWAGAAAVVASLTAVGWLATHSDVVSTEGLHPEFAEPRLVVAVMLLSTQAFVEQSIGNFGWLDTEAPFPTVLAWFAAASALLFVGLAATGARRAKAAVALLAGAVVLVPIALTVPTAEAAGIIWQGRYALPLALGIPLLGGLLASSVEGEAGRLLDRVHGLTVPVLALGHVMGFYWAARRYAEGADGDWLSLTPEWSSPLGFVPAVALFTLVVGALGWEALRTLRRTAGLGTAPAPVDRPGTPSPG